MGLLLNFWRSTIGKKVVMAVTGLLLIGFVVGHMVGHLQMFQGPDKYNAYAAFLQSLGGALWLARLGLLVATILHVTAAVQLAARQRAARPVNYRKGAQWEVSTLASRIMKIGGLFLLAFIIFHILHFTTKSIFPGYSAWNVYDNMVQGFRKPWITAFYVIAMAFLGLHLYHGAWASLRTLGAARASVDPLKRPIATVLAVVVAVGFAIIPLAILFGIITEQPATPPASHQTATEPHAVAPVVKTATPVVAVGGQ